MNTLLLKDLSTWYIGFANLIKKQGITIDWLSTLAEAELDYCIIKLG
jgi:hypothetical protein